VKGKLTMGRRECQAAGRRDRRRTKRRGRIGRRKVPELYNAYDETTASSICNSGLATLRKCSQVVSTAPKGFAAYAETYHQTFVEQMPLLFSINRRASAVSTRQGRRR
jgi:hypothetical protein